MIRTNLKSNETEDSVKQSYHVRMLSNFYKSKHNWHIGFLLKLYNLAHRIKLFFCFKNAKSVPRLIALNGFCYPHISPANKVNNQKYNFLTLIPTIILAQFRFFFNIFNMMISFIQVLPMFRIISLWTCIAPLTFILSITILKELYDDFQRYLRDKEINDLTYDLFSAEQNKIVKIEASRLTVGNVIRINSNMRVPCDCIILKTPASGVAYIHTDQLDGETDWKSRHPLSITQSIKNEIDLLNLDAWCIIEPPNQNIYDFSGVFNLRETLSTEPDFFFKDYTNDVGNPAESKSTYKYSNSFNKDENGKTNRSTFSNSENSGSNHKIITSPITLTNTLWRGTVLTSGSVLALVVYTGHECREYLNKSRGSVKSGLFENELNMMSKWLFAILWITAYLLSLNLAFNYLYLIHFIRFVLLLSSIIPISLKVNLDFAKIFYRHTISSDPKIYSTSVRNSSIAEELGRVSILLTDKTGTLTQNEMILKRLNIGNMVITDDSLMKLKNHIYDSFYQDKKLSQYSTLDFPTELTDFPSFINEIPDNYSSRISQIYDCSENIKRGILALALCHNVVPFFDEIQGSFTFQATSPDEMALIKALSLANLRLVDRNDLSITLLDPNDVKLHFEILYIFPFSWETKRMGIVVQHRLLEHQKMTPLMDDLNKVFLYVKGSDSVMLKLVESESSNWIQEQSDSFGRLGLRTLLLGYKYVSRFELDTFSKLYEEAQISVSNRNEKIRKVVSEFEKKLTIVGITGVEDKLQENVPETIEILRHAGIQVWMLTGDKLETSLSIGISSGLKKRHQNIIKFIGNEYQQTLNRSDISSDLQIVNSESILVFDGDFIDIALKEFPEKFVDATIKAPSVICCNCSPLQKTGITKALKKYTDKRIAAIGDGGNDVAMINTAHCGIAISGKEGKQASFAADFSITNFYYLHRLFFWHGRNCYQRSSKLARFIIHRGLIIASLQVFFCYLFNSAPVPLFPAWLTFGYVTYYTMLPVFSLVLNIELKESVVLLFPELYNSLRDGKPMSKKMFFSCLWASVIFCLSIMLMNPSYETFVLTAFTSLIIAELLNVSLQVSTWCTWMILAQTITIIIYFISMKFLSRHLNFKLMDTIFWCKVVIIIIFTWVPIYFLKIFLNYIYPTRDTKLAH